MLLLRTLAACGLFCVNVSITSDLMCASEPRIAFRNSFNGRPSASEQWGGRWESPAKGHAGSVHMRLRPLDESHYQGLFYGRFAKVIPYIYRAPVTRVGQTLYSEKRLGPLGSYRMVMQQYGGSLSGNWSAGSQSGPITMHRLR